MLAIRVGVYLWQIQSLTTFTPLKVKVNRLCYDKYTWHIRGLARWSRFPHKNLFYIQTFVGHIYGRHWKYAILRSCILFSVILESCLHFMVFMEKHLLVIYCFVTNYTNTWVKTIIILPRILFLGNLVWDWLNLFFWSLLISAESPQASTVYWVGWRGDSLFMLISTTILLPCSCLY